MMMKKLPEPSGNETVLNTAAEPDQIQVLDLWEEGALDIARAVRFIRKNAEVYGIDQDDTAVMGFSAGGIQAGEFLMHYDEDVKGISLDSDYIPDELDEIPAHASAAESILSQVLTAVCGLRCRSAPSSRRQIAPCQTLEIIAGWTDK